MDWDRLRIFNAAAEAGSFTNAGELLKLSQSAVSRQVTALEQELRATLFHRHARGLKLTEQGEILRDAVRTVLSAVSMAETVIAERRDKPSGPLKISCAGCFGAFWLAPRLREFLELYPEISPALAFDGGKADLAMGEADVAIRLGPANRGDHLQRRLLNSRLGAYASPEYIKRYGMPTREADLDTHRLVVQERSGRPAMSNSHWLLEAGSKRLQGRQPVATFDSIHGVLHALKSGIGIGALPHYVRPEAAGLVHVLPDLAAPEIDLYFFYAKELKASKRVTVFRDFLLRKVAEDQHPPDRADAPTGWRSASPKALTQSTFRVPADSCVARF